MSSITVTATNLIEKKQKFDNKLISKNEYDEYYKKNYDYYLTLIAEASEILSKIQLYFNPNDVKQREAIIAIKLLFNFVNGSAALHSDTVQHEIQKINFLMGEIFQIELEKASKLWPKKSHIIKTLSQQDYQDLIKNAPAIKVTDK